MARHAGRRILNLELGLVFVRDHHFPRRSFSFSEANGAPGERDDPPRPGKRGPSTDAWK